MVLCKTYCWELSLFVSSALGAEHAQCGDVEGMYRGNKPFCSHTVVVLIFVCSGTLVPLFEPSLYYCWFHFPPCSLLCSPRILDMLLSRLPGTESQLLIDLQDYIYVELLKGQGWLWLTPACWRECMESA